MNQIDTTAIASAIDRRQAKKNFSNRQKQKEVKALTADKADKVKKLNSKWWWLTSRGTILKTALWWELIRRNTAWRERWKKDQKKDRNPIKLFENYTTTEGNGYFEIRFLKFSPDLSWKDLLNQHNSELNQILENMTGDPFFSDKPTNRTAVQLWCPIYPQGRAISIEGSRADGNRNFIRLKKAADRLSLEDRLKTETFENLKKWILEFSKIQRGRSVLFVSDSATPKAATKRISQLLQKNRHSVDGKESRKEIWDWLCIWDLKEAGLTESEISSVIFKVKNKHPNVGRDLKSLRPRIEYLFGKVAVLADSSKNS